ncbi:50S ribosomal protein L11 methyltransferase [Alkalilimnicola ehrlichii]|uniref:Ribosomal protein L11 methyltransferase n=1 Tax=Alkalilimnicola ehrlichii TaxID=351052 RepID=A0A3E0X2L1_9GAMM|nr:50S ribosomal protein L11 methyltransferase [Alkalilimnicola ehrlichii]RFA31452.1 50S ribosomal protein L11 methyltransferase [Alkalilimnicola ehrlichii]RFA39278.1 50S ribosomal protein L11 methyltransferase [Alkalilimnicola ehrlichii]
MGFLQVAFQIDSQASLLIEPLLEELGAQAITFEDPGGEPVLEPGVGENPLWSEVRLLALFDENMSADLVHAAVQEALDGKAPQAWSVERLGDRCWERAWMDDFKPMRFGERLWVCPTTVSPPAPEAVNLRLDPGLAFGTGTHATTALCLRWLDRMPLEGAHVIDFGCGSGILGVASLLLGAKHCVAIDNDPQALLATGENAERNGVSPYIETFLPEAAPEVEADYVVANILAGTLIELAPVIETKVRSGGRLALSGILEEQAEAVSHVYKAWFDLNAPEVEDGWVLLQGVKR